MKDTSLSLGIFPVPRPNQKNHGKNAKTRQETSISQKRGINLL
jgi:hypothetical protein